MRRRLLKLLLAVVFLGAVAVAIVYLTRPTPGFNIENARRIVPGMTLEEVRGLFGRQEDEYRDAEATGLNGFTCFWQDDDLLITVFFERSNGRASGAYAHGPVSATNFLDLFENLSFLAQMERVVRFCYR